MSKIRDNRINALLDAAFRELQHDTGETNPEYVHSRRVLEERFRLILQYPKSKPTRPTAK